MGLENPMHWLYEQYELERHRDEQRAAEHQAQVDAARAQAAPPKKPRQVRRTLGGKLIEMGKRLQDAEPQSAPKTAS